MLTLIHSLKEGFVVSTYDGEGRLIDERRYENSQLELECGGSVRVNRYAFYSGSLIIMSRE
jgi:hypothetical protein